MFKGYSSQMFVCVCVSLTILEATLIYSAKHAICDSLASFPGHKNNDYCSYNKDCKNTF